MQTLAVATKRRLLLLLLMLLLILSSSTSAETISDAVVEAETRDPSQPPVTALLTSLSWTHHREENCSQLHLSTTTSFITSPGDRCSNSSMPPHLTAPAKQPPGGSYKGAAGGSGASVRDGARGSGPGGQPLTLEEIRHLTEQLRQTSQTGAGQQEPGESGFSCRANGNNVDWWIALKQHGSYRHVFVTSEGDNIGWQTSDDMRSSGPVFETLRQAKGRCGEVGAFYSYTSFDTNETSFGHQNGFVLFSKTGGGFWLIHSFRRLHEYFFVSNSFPNFPNPGRTKGQSFICTSHPGNHLSSILNQLNITNPRFVYRYPNANPLGAAGNAERRKEFRGIGGKTFVHFARPTGGTELYDWIAKHYNTSLLVQSWEHPQLNHATRVGDIQKQEFMSLTFRVPVC